MPRWKLPQGTTSRPILVRRPLPGNTRHTPLVLALAGGSFIFLAFVIVLILAVAYGYYSRRGSGIDQHGWNDRDRVFGTGVGKDPTADVRTWGRGSASSRPARRMTKVQVRTDEALERGGADARIAVSGRYVLDPPVDPERDHVRGSAGAAVTLVAYSEAECRYCKEAHRTVERLRARFGDDLAYVVRHFPQPVVHAHAEDAAIAMEAAARQGRFWELHDRLITSERELEPSVVDKHVRSVGLDLERFTADRADDAVRERVRQDLASGARSGVNGTPTFYLNGVRYDDDFDEEQLAAAIETAAQVVWTT